MMNNKSRKHTGPLLGLKVIDFGHYYAGPMVGMMLADQGANVIRIVKPGEKEVTEQQWRLLNRNKKLLELDLKTDDGKAKALSLIAKADVLIENFRPGVMKRLGLDYASVKEANPGLVYLSLPGFASTDKERAHIQAWDGVIAAAAGVYQSHFLRKQLNFPPVYSSIPLTSSFGAMHGALAVMAALNARETQGSGTVLEVPLAEAGLSLFGDYFIFTKQGLGGPLRTEKADQPVPVPAIFKPFVAAADDNPAVLEEKLAGGWAALYGGSMFYTTADNKKIYLCAHNASHVQRLYSALGIYGQLLREGYINAGPWENDGLQNNISKYSGAGLSPERQRRLKQLVAEVIQQRTADEWEQRLEQANALFAVLRTRAEWLSLAPLRRSGLLCQMTQGATTLTVPGRVADMSGPENALRDTNPAEPQSLSAGQAQQQFAKPQPAATRYGPVALKKSALLQGVKVLDLSNIIAGPESTYNLAQYGAEVIKLERPQHFDYPNNLRVGLEVYQGKQSVLVDLTTQPGREIFNKLVCWADIVVHNILDDTATRLGVSQAQLKAINPDVIACQLSCFGGTWRNRGGWEQRLGHDEMGQVPTGVLTHYGSVANPQFHGGLFNDVMSGLALAFSSLLGLYQRHKTGYAGEGRASLARSSCFNQLPWMIDENGNSDWGEPGGQSAVGPSGWQRLYQCCDGWLFVGAHRERRHELMRQVTGGEPFSELELEAAFITRSCNHWQALLNAADIGCHRVMSVEDICAQGMRHVDNQAADETATASTEVLLWPDHPCGKPVVCLAPSWVRVGEQHSYRRLPPAPRRGAHTRTVLQTLGYRDEQIEALVRLKVAHDYLPALGSREVYFLNG